MTGRWLALLASLLVAFGAGADRAGAASSLSPEPYCKAVVRALDDQAPGGGPVLIASYQPGPGERELPGPLRTSAFSYDNALAAIALVACGDVAGARRIADAFVFASDHDRAFHDGRIRNAYRAGPVGEGPVKLPGWWDASAGRWYEDAYQDGTATGNVAWVALALLNVHAATEDERYLRGAERLLAWIAARAADAPGYSGGLAGFDNAQQALRWKSTEHNIDVSAAASWAHRLTGESADAAMAEQARTYVAAHFLVDSGYFLIGSKSDGSDADPHQIVLDVQVWPTLGVPQAPADWRRAIAYAETHLRRGDGMTFAGIGPNRWTEGTAQAALALRAIGDKSRADALLASLPAVAAPSGLLYATSDGVVPTGLEVEAGGGAFQYFHRPHLGATAWAVLAALGWNPFTGKRVD